MSTPQPSLELQRWSRRYAIAPTSLQAIVERAHEGPTVPPFNGLPDATRRELGALSLQALTELRELTEEYILQTHPSGAPIADPAAQAPAGAATQPASLTGRQPRSAWPAMDALPEALWIEDVSVPSCPIVYTNQAFTDLTGHPRDHVLGQPLSALQTGLTDASIDPADDAALRGVGTSWSQTRDAARQLRDVVAGGRSGSAQIVIRHAEGHLLHVQLTLAPVTESDGEVVHYVAVLRSLR